MYWRQSYRPLSKLVRRECRTCLIAEYLRRNHSGIIWYQLSCQNRANCTLRHRDAATLCESLHSLASGMVISGFIHPKQYVAISLPYPTQSKYSVVSAEMSTVLIHVEVMASQRAAEETSIIGVVSK